jgi:hypothetical protein
MLQAVGELPEAHRNAAPMEVDPPSTSQENAGGQPGDAAANGSQKRPRWKERGLRVLTSAHTRPLDHQEVVQTMADGNVADWDAWECVVNEAVKCASISAV